MGERLAKWPHRVREDGDASVEKRDDCKVVRPCYDYHAVIGHGMKHVWHCSNGVWRSDMCMALVLLTLGASSISSKRVCYAQANVP